MKRCPGCLPGRVAHVSTLGSYLIEIGRGLTATLCLSQGFVFSAHIASKSQLAVGDFALGLTCQKGRISDIHRHWFVDIKLWCWPYPGQVVTGLLKNMQFYWCKFAKWPSVILWVALKKYLVINLGKKNTFPKCVNNVCTLKGCSSAPVCIILFCNISVW